MAFLPQLLSNPNPGLQVAPGLGTLPYLSGPDFTQGATRCASCCAFPASPSGTSALQGPLMATLQQMALLLMGLLQNAQAGQSGQAGSGQANGADSVSPLGASGDSGGSQAGASGASGADKASKETAGPATGNIVSVPGGRVDSSIASEVTAMMAAAKKDGVNLKISSSFRSRAEQEKLYAAYKNGTGNLAAKPGTSNHEKGLAIDFADTPGAYAWLKANSGRFGLKNLPSEPWHYSTTGT